MRRKWIVATVAICGFSLGSPALLAEDLSTSTFSAGSAECEDLSPDVAASRGGSFLLVWSRLCGLEPFRVAARLYDAEARPIGPEIDLGPGTSTNLVALPDGGYALAWIRSLTPFDSELYLAHLDARGRPIGAPFPVDGGAPDPSWKYQPRLAVDGAGNLALLWQRSQAIPYHTEFLLRRFGADFAPRSEVLSFADRPPYLPDAPDLAFAENDDLLVVWGQSNPEDPSLFSAIFGRRYPADGTPAGPSFRITSLDTGGHSNPRLLGARRLGGWLMAWQRGDFLGTGDSRFAYLSPGTIQLGQTSGTVFDPSQEVRAEVALGADSGGNALLIAEPREAPLSGRLFDPLGTPLGNPLEVAPRPVWDLDGPTFSRSATGSFLAVWAAAEKVVVDIDVLQPQGWDLRGRIFRRSCPIGESAACLLSERFGIEVLRPGAGGAMERARPIRLDDGGALFAFPGRIPEVAVSLRVNPGTGTELTYSAATNNAVTFRVTDRVTGRVESVIKPAGRFASGRLGISSLAALPPGAVGAAAPAAAPALPIGLVGNRFQVDVNWTDPLGAKQKARGALFDDRRAAFRFGDDLDLIVSLIDGRASNGKFWVSLGGLSGEAYRVKVTDTETGRIKLYNKPAGRPLSQVDRQAF